MRTIFLGLGANCAGAWGSPRATLVRVLHELSSAGVTVVRSSSLYSTRPVGGGRQPHYYNAVVEVETALPAAALLRLVKSIEREAGRRLGRLWGPRPLDIDLLDVAGRRLGRPWQRRQPGQLILPHPELHRRAFVLVPLREIAPKWRHPWLGVRVGTLLARLSAFERAGVRHTLDSAAFVCDKQRK